MQSPCNPYAATRQAKTPDLLQQADPEHFGWWVETLVGKMPDTAPTAA